MSGHDPYYPPGDQVLEFPPQPADRPVPYHLLNIRFFPKEAQIIPRSHKILLLISSICFLIILSGCGPTEDFSPGRYHTTHQGQSWILGFEPNGSWSGTFSGELLTSGTYSIDGNELTFLTDSHCQETGYPGAATYRLRIRNGSLTFSRIGSDPCLSRQVILEDEVYNFED